ncbi:hypothetical protein [Rhizobium herbae]
MFSKSSLKAILLCGCGLFVVTNGFPVSSTNAGDFPLGRASSPVLPTIGQANSENASITPSQQPILPSALSNMPGVRTVEKAAPVLPNNSAVSLDLDLAPGENPFVQRSVQQLATQPLVSQTQAEPVAVSSPLRSTASAAIQASANPFVTPGSTQKASAETPIGEKTGPRVDETALRYYASIQDLKRLGAELRRLKALYPEWETPDNLFDPVSTVQEQPLWDIYATGNYAAVRAELARLQTANPQWKPSKDLMAKLRLGETRLVIERSYTRKNWRQIIQIGQENPELLVCSNINVLWQVGESLAQTRDFARSFDLYKYILTTCSDPQERLATVQKASELLPDQGLQSLVALGSILPDGSSEFESVGFEPLRRKMGAISSGEEGIDTSAGMTELEIFSAYVQRNGSADDAGLFGWYYFSQQDYEAAHAWFMAATQLANNPKNIEGVVLSLRKMDKPNEAMAFAKRYGKNSPLVTKQYIEIIAAALTSKDTGLEVSEQELAIFEKAVFATKSANGAQALGWKKLEEKDTEAAKDLFAASLSWEPTQGGVIGSAVIATRAKNGPALATIKASYGKKYVELNKFTIYTKKRSTSEKTIRSAKNRNKKTVEKKGFFETLFRKS